MDQSPVKQTNSKYGASYKKNNYDTFIGDIDFIKYNHYGKHFDTHSDKF